jgi:nucleoside-diphosphate-sugar epimerase
MARVLIVGCGCRGRELAGELRARGHAVRGTTRLDAGRTALEAAGIEAWVGDPDRIGTLTYALDGVTILCWLMGSARGTPEQLAALHGSRLKMLLERTIDTTVRGVV